ENSQSRASATPSHPSPPTSTASLSPTESALSSDWLTHNSSNEPDNETTQSRKRARISRTPSPSPSSMSSTAGSRRDAPLFQSPEPPVKTPEVLTKRPWKEIYSERLIVE